MKLRVLSTYHSAKLSAEGGTLIEVDELLGQWLLQDAPGSFEDVNAPKKKDKDGKVVEEDAAPAGDRSPDGSTGEAEIPPEPDVTVVEKAPDGPPANKAVQRAPEKKRDT